MRGFFKGWYFKAQNELQTVALIPAMHISETGERSASIQIISDHGVWNVRYPYEQFHCEGNRPRAVIGESAFSEYGLSLKIWSEEVTVWGDLEFGPLSPLRYDIMGPFCLIPHMECRHSVYSMTHRVTGRLWINGEAYMYPDGTGYIEGDRGCSFPKRYAWTQCLFQDRGPASIALSIAEIPFGPVRFTGIIGIILWRGREYRLATYLGAKALDIGNGTLRIRQGNLSLTAKLIRAQDRLLFAPVRGSMGRRIRESMSCTAYYRLEERGCMLFELESSRASFEYEYGC
ncbi:MAG: hypothetical protein VB086_11890 [Clostridiaceae bacterium]|nr:hypothetical protein [Clostridiaceae bacterium]